MMRALRSMVLLTVAVLGGAYLSGCAPEEQVKPKPMPTPIMMASPEQVEQVRADILKLDPNARVGTVAAVSASSSTAAVSGIAPEDLKKGDTVSFTDSRQTPIAGGTVFLTHANGPTDSNIIIDYDITPGGRAPARGDIVIYLPRH